MQTTLTPALRFEIKELIDERIREKHVTREDFTELKDIVKEIAREQRELAIAQKETQKEMKEAQKEIKSLALAIKDTKEELKSDIGELRRDLNYTRKDLGGVTQTLGFMLENEAYRILPKLLKDRYKIEVKERFLRRSIRSFGIEAEGEVNIFSHGVKQDEEQKVVIIGEAKSQLGKDDIDCLLDTVARLKDIEKELGRFLLVVTHYTKETVVSYAKEKGVEVIQSFEW